MTDRRDRSFHKNVNDRYDQNRTSNLGPAKLQRQEYHDDKDMLQLFLNFKRQWESYSAITFDSALESIIEENKLPSLPIVDITGRVVPDEKDKIATMIFEAELKTLVTERTKRQQLLKTQTDTYYTTLWQQLGLSMQNQIRMMKDFKLSHDTKNAAWLWNAYKSLCMKTVSLNDSMASGDSITQFTGMRIRKYETIHSYYVRFEQSYEAYKGAGNPEFPEPTLIQLFNKSLDERYYEYVKMFRNDLMLKKAVPSTVIENYQAAARFLTSVGGGVQSSSQGAVFMTGDQLGNRMKKQHHKKNSEFKSENAGAGDNKGNKSEGTGGSKKKLPRAEWLKTITCHGCGET